MEIMEGMMSNVPTTGKVHGQYVTDQEKNDRTYLTQSVGRDHANLQEGSPVREGEVTGMGSSDKEPPSPKSEPQGHEAQPLVGRPGSHSENVR